MHHAKRILVVDDNSTLRTLLAQLLEANGYVAIGAESAEQAMEVARFDPPDLWVVDQVMPGETGADLIRRLRTSGDERLRDAPTIGLTGFAGAERELLEAGADYSIRKPCDDGPLLETIARALAAA